MIRNSNDLTRGERLFIQRRREGRTQVAEAARRGVSRFVYGCWELDRHAPGADDVCLVDTGNDIQPHEKCVVYRRRAGVLQKTVAEGLEVSRYWVNVMERGRAPCDALLWYWEH